MSFRPDRNVGPLIDEALESGAYTKKSAAVNDALRIGFAAMRAAKEGRPPRRNASPKGKQS